MRIVFAGTPEFAVPALNALIRADHELVAVLTRPDRPAGRGLVQTGSPVKRKALEHGIDVLQPVTLKSPDTQAHLGSLQPDALVVVAYGLLLPPPVLAVAPYGALNIHASLLPRWRGAAPIQRALLAGDRETGISIMQMDAGLDTGAVLMRAAIPILPSDSAGTLHDRLAQLGAELVVAALEGLERGTRQPVPQPDSGVTYAPKIEKAEAHIDWSADAQTIAWQIRAFDPQPGASVRCRGMDIKIWRAAIEANDEAGLPGSVLAVEPAGVTVACGRGALRLEELQRAGGRRLPAEEFLRGFPIAVGDRFDDVDIPRSTPI